MPASSDTSRIHTSTSPTAWTLLLISILFIGSGCAALIYEIVWFQVLQLAIGSSAVSMGVLLATFMGGMCLGSLFFDSIVPRRFHPLFVYALLELLIGIFGASLIYVIPVATSWYSSVANTGTSDIWMRAFICLICLLPPTVCMGATLPAIARWLTPTREGVSMLGWFYGANIAGGVFGCLLTSFYLLRLFDLATATFVAVLMNLFIAGLGWLLSQYSANLITSPAAEGEARGREKVSWATAATYVAIFLSGVTALGAEIIWTRQLSLILGATVYSFSIILAVYLVGLGIGSSLGAMIAKTNSNPARALALAQWSAAVAIGWAAFSINCSIPYWPIAVEVAQSPWEMFPVDLVRAVWVVLPGAIAWGFSFPMALAVIIGTTAETSRSVGRVYAANTIGAIIGASGFSVLMIGWYGTQISQMVLIIIASLAALLMLVTAIMSKTAQHNSKAVEWILTITVLATAFFLTTSISETPRELIGYGKSLSYWRYQESSGQIPMSDFDFVAEGMNASIAVSTSIDNDRQFHVSGKVVASSDPADMKLQRLLGHLPALIHPEPKSVLIVGCGAGVTAGTFTRYPSIERIVICEIEPLIPTTAGKFFGKENHHVMDDPRVEVYYDDARHFILTTNESFDIITSDPIHPWVKGAAALYSKEYFELCKKKLTTNGVVTQWIPLYESSLETVKSEIGTFCEAFPDATIWSNESFNQGFDLVMLGQNTPQRPLIDIATMADQIVATESINVSLDEVELNHPLVLLTTYAGNAKDLKPFLTDAQINRDANLRLQFLAGMSINQQSAPVILKSLLQYRKFPEELFSDSSDGEVWKRQIKATFK